MTTFLEKDQSVKLNGIIVWSLSGVIQNLPWWIYSVYRPGHKLYHFLASRFPGLIPLKISFSVNKTFSGQSVLRDKLILNSSTQTDIGDFLISYLLQRVYFSQFWSWAIKKKTCKGEILLLYLFTDLISPILSYGCKIWGNRRMFPYLLPIKHKPLNLLLDSGVLMIKL